MPILTIETKAFLMNVDAENNYMEYFIKPDILFEAKDAIEAREVVIRHFPGIKFHVYAEGMGFFNVTKEARQIASNKDHLDNTLAIAFYSENISIYLLGELYHKINKPPVLTKIFNNREKARSWLKTQMDLNYKSKKNQEESNPS
jgi:hypothetical protein